MSRLPDTRDDVECSGGLLNMLEDRMGAVCEFLREDGKEHAYAAQEAKLAKRIAYMRRRVRELLDACARAGERGRECVRSPQHSMLVHRDVHKGVAEAVHVLGAVSRLVRLWRGHDDDQGTSPTTPSASASPPRTRSRGSRGSRASRGQRDALMFLGGAAFCEQQVHEELDNLLHSVDMLLVMVGGEAECEPWACASLVTLCVEHVVDELMRGDHFAQAAADPEDASVVPHPLWADVLTRVYARDGLNERVMRELVAGDGLVRVDMRGCMWARDAWLRFVGMGECTTVVDVRNCERLSGAGLAHLQPLSRQLQELRAGPVAVDHVRQISFLAKCPQLHTLVLEGLTIGRGGPLTMRAPRLRVLDVHGAETRHGQVKLTKTLSLRKQPPTLRELDISSSHVVASEGAWADWACRESVEVLRCSGLHMEPELDLSAWTALRRVNLSRSWVSPDAAHVVLELPHIEWMGLYCPRAMSADDVALLRSVASDTDIALSTRTSTAWGEWMTLIDEARHDEYLHHVLLTLEGHRPAWDAWEPSDGALDVLKSLLECPFTPPQVLSAVCFVLQVCSHCEGADAVFDVALLDMVVALMRRHVRQSEVVENTCLLLCAVLERDVVPLSEDDATRYMPLLCEVMRLYYADAHVTSWTCHVLLTMAGTHPGVVRYHVLELIRAGVTAPWVHHLLASAHGDDESFTTEAVVRLLWACCSPEGKQVLHDSDVILPALLRTLRWSCSRVATRASGLRQACLGCWACLCHEDGHSAAYLAGANALPLLFRALQSSFTTDRLSLSTQYAACCVDAVMEVLHDTEHAPAGVSRSGAWEHMIGAFAQHPHAIAPRLMRAVDALLGTDDVRTTGAHVCRALVRLLRCAGMDEALWEEEELWCVPVLTTVARLALEAPLDKLLVDEGVVGLLFDYVEDQGTAYHALVALRNLTADVEEAAAIVCTSADSPLAFLLDATCNVGLPAMMRSTAAAVLMNATALAPAGARPWLDKLLAHVRALRHSPLDRSGQVMRALILCAHNVLHGECPPHALPAVHETSRALLACTCEQCAGQHAMARMLLRGVGSNSGGEEAAGGGE